MSDWAARRFWTDVSVTEEDGAFAIRLDQKPLHTPGKRRLLLSNRPMAEALAREWEMVEKKVDPGRMPVTRAVNSAIDKVAPQFDEVVALVAAYGGSDLVCYRAEAPAELRAEQASAWDPYLDWCATELAAPLNVTYGIVPIAQPESSLRRFSESLSSMTPYQITALHDLVSLSGSLVLGLAATRDGSDPDTLWRLSRIDEDWQARQWGRDADAEALAASKQSDFRFAWSFWRLASANRA